MNYNHCLLFTKHRLIDEINDVLSTHPVYKDSVRAVARMHANKERAQQAVYIGQASATRIRQAPDDYVNRLQSFVSMFNINNKPSTSIEWVWEDTANISRYINRQDVKPFLVGANKIQLPAGTVLTSGKGSLEAATSFLQADLWVNGTRVLPIAVDGAAGLIYIKDLVDPVNDVVELSYWKKNLTPPGYYIVELTPDAQEFYIKQLWSIDDEILSKNTTGLENSFQLKYTSGVSDKDFQLFTKHETSKERLYLEPGVDFSVSSSGLITLLNPVLGHTQLFSSYNVEGPDLGPFPVVGQYQAESQALPGVVLAFGNRIVGSDAHIIKVNKEREPVAKVYGGHYEMSISLIVDSLDPQTTMEISDYIVDKVWADKRQLLENEGITITQFEPSSESEESYEDTIGKVYFLTDISCQVITEWKKLVPYQLDYRQFDIIPYVYPELLSLTESALGTPLASSSIISYPSYQYPKYL